MSVLDAGRISALDADVPVGNLQFVSFDVETTGLSPVVARLVELSAVKFSLNGSDVSHFSSLINPETTIPKEVTAVHGITQEMVSDAPLAADVIPRFMEWVGGEDTVMVAHNANFDLGFMRVALMKLGLTLPRNPVVDSLFLSRQLVNDAPNHQLKTLVQYLELESGEYHRALADSQHVKNLLKCLISLDSSLATWGALIESGCVLSFQGSEDFAPAPPKEILALVQSIKEAISQGSLLSLMYKGYRSRSRIVKPLALIQSSGRYYLNAYCQYVEAERTFRLDKIGNMKIINSLQMETTRRRTRHGL